MHIDIAPIYDEAYECFQGILVSLAKHFGYEYELMFASSWRFELLPESSANSYCLLGDRLEQPWKVSYVELLRIYHGISVIHKPVDTIDALLALIENEMQKGLPVSLSIDSFWCHWTYTYNKYHYNHTILIIGVEKESKLLQCIDPYYSSKVEEITFSEIIGKFDNCSIFELSEPFLKDIIWYQVVAESIALLKYGSEKSAFNEIRRFADKVEKKLDIRVEIEGYDTIYAAPIFVQLKKIRSYRISFAKTLLYLAQKYEIEKLYISSTNMLEVGNMWSQLSMILIKAAMVPQQNQEVLKNRAADLIRNIANIEENIAHTLLQTICEFGGKSNG